MIPQDAINALFELAGGLAVWRHCVVLYQQKKVRGVSVLATTLFASWGVWNLYYYPWLGQWLSFLGGISIVSGNMVWIGMMYYYMRKESR
jgi:hypothetical protein